jgi:hypothetical protein
MRNEPEGTEVFAGYMYKSRPRLSHLNAETDKRNLYVHCTMQSPYKLAEVYIYRLNRKHV